MEVLQFLLDKYIHPNKKEQFKGFLSSAFHLIENFHKTQSTNKSLPKHLVKIMKDGDLYLSHECNLEFDDEVFTMFANEGIFTNTLLGITGDDKTYKLFIRVIELLITNKYFQCINNECEYYQVLMPNALIISPRPDLTLDDLAPIYDNHNFEMRKCIICTNPTEEVSSEEKKQKIRSYLGENFNFHRNEDLLI